jgi:hypothetical protein
MQKPILHINSFLTKSSIWFYVTGVWEFRLGKIDWYSKDMFLKEEPMDS